MAEATTSATGDVATYYNGHRPEMVALIDQPPRKVLELGCGDGSFRSSLTDVAADFEYWGIEPFAEAAALAEKQLDRVFACTYEEALAELPDGYFDLVVCNDVIEHLVSHDYFFETIRTKMTGDASIVGSVPNVRHLSNIINMIGRKDWQYEDDGILDTTHLRFFTEKSLRRTFEQHGYQLEALKYLKIIKPRIHPPSRLFYNLLILFLGQDTRALQFGFRVRV